MQPLKKKLWYFAKTFIGTTEKNRFPRKKSIILTNKV